MKSKDWKWMVLGVFMLVGGMVTAGIAKNPDANTLWMETFKDSASLAKWRNDGGFKLEAVDGLLVADPKGAVKKNSPTIGKYVAYDKTYPYFQINLESLDQLKGYKGWTVSNSSTGGGFFTSMGGGVIPGLWTFNINDCLKLEKEKGSFFLRIDMHGYVFKYKSFKMMKAPVNALLATTAEKVLKPGDAITFKLVLETPCKDATVNIRQSYCLVQLQKINEAGYVQMTSEDKGRTWKGKLKVTKRGFGEKTIKQGGLIFQCNMLGGKLRKVFTSNSFTIDCGK